MNEDQMINTIANLQAQEMIEAIELGTHKQVEKPPLGEFIPIPRRKLPLSFTELQLAATERSNTNYFPISHWSPMEWCCALAGEVGELCNEVKKNGDNSRLQEIKNEMADVAIYLCLTAEKHGIDLEKAIIEKFNNVSLSKGFKVLLPEHID
jgi:NTP pyrophosphatase (non-canonical NTP hydrolase)